ncbi:MAG: DUF177 domain-containing protein [bacterium]
MITIDLRTIPKGHSHQEFEWTLLAGDSPRENKETLVIGRFDINNKFDSDYDFKGIIEFDVKLKCDRCTEIFEKHFTEEVRFIIKKNSMIEDLDIINTDSNIVKLKSYIKDIVHTAIPMQNICSEDCRGICTGCGVNLNKETCKCNKQED